MLCHIAWRALAQTRRASGGRKTTPRHTPAGAPRRFLKEREIQLLTWPRCSTDLSPLDSHLWQEWETLLGERQFQPQLELRAMFVRTMSDLDPIAAAKACTTWFNSHMISVRTRQRRPPLVMDQLTCTRFFWSPSTRLETRTKESNRWAGFFCAC